MADADLYGSGFFEGSEDASPALIRVLAELAPRVFFSAAIPGPGDTSRINPQWESYWARLFATHWLYPVDVMPTVDAEAA